MGYETTLIVVDTFGKGCGYMSIIATLDLCKTDYDGKIYEMSDTRNKTLDPETASEITVLLDELRKHEELPRSKINWQKYFEIQNGISSKTPYLYYKNGEFPQFDDDCGNLHIQYDVAEVRKAVISDLNGSFGGSGYRYGDRRLEAAVRFLDAFMDTSVWPSEYIKVILWGH